MKFSESHPAVSQSLPLEKVRAVLFDLDGTLLGVDMQQFIPAYLDGLAVRLADLAHRRQVARVMREAVIDILTRVDGRPTLEERMLTYLEDHLEIPAERYQAALDAFCQENLHELQSLIQGHPLATALLTASQDRGWQIVLATNPIFPRRVIDARIAWAGLDASQFTFVTDYETSRHCKPHREYFYEVLDRLGLPAETCLMVGNDTQHDMAAGQAGLLTCLLTPWRIDHRESCFQADWEGTHEELLPLLRQSASSLLGKPASVRTQFLTAD